MTRRSCRLLLRLTPFAVRCFACQVYSSFAECCQTGSLRGAPLFERKFKYAVFCLVEVAYINGWLIYIYIYKDEYIKIFEW